MPAGGSDEQQLGTLVRALECGAYGRVLFGGQDHGPPPLVQRFPLLLLLARAQAEIVRGDLLAVGANLERTVDWLPALFLCRSKGGAVRVVLPTGCAAVTHAARLAKIVWREERELGERRRQARDMSVRDALIEAVIEVITWGQCDPYYRFVPGSEAGPPPELLPQVDRTPGGIRERATRLRQFGRPTAGSVSPSAWTEACGYDGLRDAALDALAERPVVPWLGEPGTDGLPVRRGRLYAKEFADRRREDRNPWA